MKNDIILKKITLNKTIISYEFETCGNISKLLKKQELWIDYGSPINNIPESILTIPFISIMLPLIWVSNATLWITKIDRTFYDATFKLRRAYSDLYPNFSLKGKIIPSYIIDNYLPIKNDGFMLFSGGLDAHTSYIRNIDIIKQLINIQGWYKSRNEINKVAENDFSKISIFAKKNNLEFYGIKSNFATLVSLKYYKKYAKKMGDSLWHGFQHSMAFISITIPLVYKKNGGQIIIASSFTVGDERVCASYPTTDNEFRFAKHGKVKHDGFELSRQDKIRLIVNHQKNIKTSYPIQVCSFNNGNCCKCEKCFRTILGLIAEGANIEDFGFKIDKLLLEYYQNYFKKNIAFFGVANESQTHWPYIIKRMHENYYKLTKYHDFINWFLNYNFKKEKRKAILKYYVFNFFSIIKRKIYNG